MPLILFNICIVAVSGLCVWLPPLPAIMVLNFLKFIYLIALLDPTGIWCVQTIFWVGQYNEKEIRSTPGRWSEFRLRPRRNGEVSHLPSYTSGHDYLDAERASCPRKTHWNTVWSNRGIIGRFPSFPLQHTAAVPVPHQIPRFQVWGSKSQSRKFFLMWLQWQLMLIDR